MPPVCVCGCASRVHVCVCPCSGVHEYDFMWLPSQGTMSRMQAWELAPFWIFFGKVFLASKSVPRWKGQLLMKDFDPNW